MPLFESAQGQPLAGLKTVETELSPVWTMNFAASCDDVADAFMDTTDDRTPLVHPVFMPACVEVVSAFASLYAAGVTKEEITKHTFLHHFCDTTFERPMLASGQVRTETALVRVEQKRKGVFTGTKFSHYDADNILISTGYFGGVVDGLQGADAAKATTVAEVPGRIDFPPADAFDETEIIDIPPTAAHIFDACIRNPRKLKSKNSDINVHTSIGFAKKAGLLARTMNGLGVLGRVVSLLLKTRCNDDPTLLRRMCCTFSSPLFLRKEVVPLLVRIADRVTKEHGRVIFFQVFIKSNMQKILSNGALILRGNRSRL
ncbi:Hypothetical Protein FCC1311_050852 [Hondaea fermentalgiana]|uniref:Peroxisomal multifunctional enzyme type 2 n=1 Tax=Hondaea fermentalgiana TaxID=2315210 RepID=A0A2R5GLW7_9STRA|nr:Hypothetical Protein FCC1311_050852 [Hondaea fermentalgiana]|eukprot:GBG28864.1 Hypothetical Protein FCC1311_050852 [Hondaea fermentalgiana]